MICVALSLMLRHRSHLIAQREFQYLEAANCTRGKLERLTRKKKNTFSLSATGTSSGSRPRPFHRPNPGHRIPEFSVVGRGRSPASIKTLAGLVEGTRKREVSFVSRLCLVFEPVLR